MSQFQSDQFGRARSVVLSTGDARGGKPVWALLLSVLAFVPLAPALGAALGWGARRRAARTGGTPSRLAFAAVALGVLFTLAQLSAGALAFGPWSDQVRSALAF